MHRSTFAFYVFAAAFIGCDDWPPGDGRPGPWSQAPKEQKPAPTEELKTEAESGSVAYLDDGKVKYCPLSPVIPTAVALADETTIRAVLSNIAGTNFMWPLPLNDSAERNIACSGAMAFMDTVYAMTLINPETEYEDQMALVKAAGWYYGMNGLYLANMRHWNVVWFHTALFAIPHYHTQCGDLTIGDITFTCDEGEDQPAVCEDSLENEVRQHFGEEVYPGITDPEKASAEVLRIGITAETDDIDTMKWLAFQAYSGTVWSAWNKILPWDREDKMTPAELERALALVERSFPIVDYSWSDGMEPKLYALGCEEKLPKARRQKFLDLTRRRLQKSNLWKSGVAWTYEPLPVTVDELCKRDEEMPEPEPLDPPGTSSPPIPGAAPKQNQIPPDPAAPWDYPSFPGISF